MNSLRLGLPRWVAIIIAAIAIFICLSFWPPPFKRGTSALRIGFAAEFANGTWTVRCALNQPPTQDSTPEAAILGVLTITLENVRSFFFKTTIYQRAQSRSSVESHSLNLDEPRLRTTIDLLRPQIATAANELHPGIDQAILQEPAQVERILWKSLWHRGVMILLILAIWWVCGGREGDKTLSDIR